jgi:hypothetical protein
LHPEARALHRSRTLNCYQITHLDSIAGRKARVLMCNFYAGYGLPTGQARKHTWSSTTAHGPVTLPYLTSGSQRCGDEEDRRGDGKGNRRDKASGSGTGMGRTGGATTARSGTGMGRTSATRRRRRRGEGKWPNGSGLAGWAIMGRLVSWAKLQNIHVSVSGDDGWCGGWREGHHLLN